MTDAGAAGDIAGWFHKEAQRVREATKRLNQRHECFEEELAQAAQRIAAQAESIEIRQAALELRKRPAIELGACILKLREHGVRSLSGRERRALVTHPAHVPVQDAERVLKQWPRLLTHLLRTCLANWFEFRGQDWGREYYGLLLSAAKTADVPFLTKSSIGPARALSRGDMPGNAQLALSLPFASIGEVYAHLRHELSLRDSWIYTGQVLASWLEQVGARQSLDGTIHAIQAHPRLRAMLLPSDASRHTAIAGVRSEPLTHAQVVVAVLRAAHASPPLIATGTLAELTTELFHSSFKDPRSPPLSQGWELVKQMANEPFRKFLASLSEQDLEVFFGHAMHEPDRRRFWMRYLPRIERTGCVLDASSQERLRAKLQASPELRGAIDRAYRFSKASSVQAFFLVFPRIVVVEFSDKGNAAYAYEREYFEQKLEQRVCAGRCDGVGELKMSFQNLHRIMHHRGWEESTAQWLSAQGIHR